MKERGETMGAGLLEASESNALSRDEAIKNIRSALRRRSGKAWSVRGGSGTSWGWIEIDAPPARRTWGWRLKPGLADSPENYEEYDTGHPGGHASPADRAELARLLNLADVHWQGVSIAAGRGYRIEVVDRAEGRVPRMIGEPYWD